MITATRYPSLAHAVAIVTGGASGIGAAVVRAFCEQGSRVAFLDINVAAGRALADELAELHGTDTALFVPCDLTDIPALRAALDTSKAAFGPATVLVNNAADDRREVFEDVSVEDFDHMMNVNLRHVYFACQAIAAQMREAGHGAIINMSSGAWLAGSPDSQSYVATKAAIVGLTNSLARLLGPDRIRVNAVAPGAVQTPRQMALWHTEESMRAVVAQQCIKEQMLPDHVARTVLFLAADDANMISKQLIFVNGGLR